jgi:hypothetical protein
MITCTEREEYAYLLESVSIMRTTAAATTITKDTY